MVELYRRIETEADLPPAGTAREGLSLDAKRDPYFNGFELAKDMAAFANAVGGVVIVGAEEVAKLIQYNPLSREIADRQAQAFEDAVRDRCSPAPIVKPFVLSQGGGYVVAVNVDAFPGQPVGVAVDGGKNKQGVGFAFPLRVASQTTWLLPEQLSMLMLPELRQKAILLSSIPPASRATIVLVSANETASVGALVDVDEQAASATFSLTAVAGNAAAPGPFHLPLAAIRHIWRGAAGYRVSFVGGIHFVSGQGWEYVSR